MGVISSGKTQIYIIRVYRERVLTLGAEDSARVEHIYPANFASTIHHVGLDFGVKGRISLRDFRIALILLFSKARIQGKNKVCPDPVGM